MFYATGPDGRTELTLLEPIPNVNACKKCHGPEKPVSGVLKITTSLSAVERDIATAQRSAVAVIAASLVLTLLFTALILKRAILSPIRIATDAMRQAAEGNLKVRAPSSGVDEIAQMAGSFNTMVSELERTQDGLIREQDKLMTIIRSAKEAIVVADSEDRITLANQAASSLLGKDNDTITNDGFMLLFDDLPMMERLLADNGGIGEIFQRGSRVLSIQASRIFADDGHYVGAAALVRDVTAEKQLEDQLRKLSTTDGLTGLFNRRHLDDSLAFELGRAKRYSRPLSILMFDIDHFKRFNDEHGHEIGDMVLVSVAETIRLVLRAQDYPCRYGGEEFLAILPDTPEEGAFTSAERMRKAISELNVNGLGVTVSIGAATFPGVPSVNSKDFLEMADKALYEAKRNGRNQTKVAGRNDGRA